MFFIAVPTKSAHIFNTTYAGNYDISQMKGEIMKEMVENKARVESADRK